jgi:hypothetical protein
MPFSKRCPLILFFARLQVAEARSQTEPEMKSLILKRSVVLRGHKTSISNRRCILELGQGNCRFWSDERVRLT